MKEVKYGGGSHICNKCRDKIFGSKIHRCPFPKGELERWYRLYLTESEKFHNFKEWLESTDLYNYAGLAEKCKFSTTAELRKQIDILENKYSVSKKITESTKNSGFSVYIPENAKSNLQIMKTEYLKPTEVKKELPNKDGYYFVDNLNELANSRLFFSLQTLRWYYDSSMYDEAEENFIIWYKPVILEE